MWAKGWKVLLESFFDKRKHSIQLHLKLKLARHELR
jgi:hypothetical protein